MPNNNNGTQGQWKQLCEAARLELEPTKLLERIGEARNAVLDRIEDHFSKSTNEHLQMANNKHYVTLWQD
jgi:hypothetical protein